MARHIACARCSRLGEFEVTGETGDAVEDVEVDVKGGVLGFICDDCLTGPEAVAKLRASAVRLLEAAEEQIESIEMVRERIPALKDDPELTARHADAQEQARHARATLAATENFDVDS
jgi:hypothetical protein